MTRGAVSDPLDYISLCYCVTKQRAIETLTSVTASRFCCT